MGSRILDFSTASSQVPSVLLDTSVLIYYLERIEPYNLLAVVNENTRGFLSVISITEFVAKPFVSSLSMLKLGVILFVVGQFCGVLAQMRSALLPVSDLRTCDKSHYYELIHLQFKGFLKC